MITSPISTRARDARLSGFGQTGPYSDRPGFGTPAEAMSGFAYLNGYPDQEPLLPPTGLADGIAAMFSTMAVAFALYNRDANGGTGQYIDTSLIEPIFRSSVPSRPLPAARRDRNAVGEPLDVVRAAERVPDGRRTGGRHLGERAADRDAGVRRDRAAPDLKTIRFADNEKRLENVEALDAAIQDWMDDHTREAVIDRFEEYEATIAPIYNVADILADEHYQARDAVVEVPDDQLGAGAVQNTVPRFSETPGRSPTSVRSSARTTRRCTAASACRTTTRRLRSLDSEGVI